MRPSKSQIASLECGVISPNPLFGASTGSAVTHPILGMSTCGKTWPKVSPAGAVIGEVVAMRTGKPVDSNIAPKAAVAQSQSPTP